MAPSPWRTSLEIPRTSKQPSVTEKYRSFELFRRHTQTPEVITFDELFHRAKFIVDHVGT